MPDDSTTGSTSRESWPRLNGDLLSTSLLAFLKNWNAYGYQLTQRLAESGMPHCDSGTVYRTLRQLERSGLVSSFWDTSESGPARRMYSLTTAGDMMLSTWIDVLQHYQNVLHAAVQGFTTPPSGGQPGEPKERQPDRDDHATGASSEREDA